MEQKTVFELKQILDLVADMKKFLHEKWLVGSVSESDLIDDIFNSYERQYYSEFEKARIKELAHLFYPVHNKGSKKLYPTDPNGILVWPGLNGHTWSNGVSVDHYYYDSTTQEYIVTLTSSWYQNYHEKSEQGKIKIKKEWFDDLSNQLVLQAIKEEIDIQAKIARAKEYNEDVLKLELLAKKLGMKIVAPENE